MTTRQQDAPVRPAPVPRQAAEPEPSHAAEPRELASVDLWGRMALSGGLLVIGYAVLAMLAWHLHWSGVLRFQRGYTAIRFNTALALAATGTAVAIAGRGPSWMVRAAGVVVLVIGGASLIETATGWDFGIDDLLADPYLTANLAHPGRMAANAAVCFVVVGLGLLLWRPGAGRWRGSTIGVAGTVVAAIASVATIGYLLGTPSAYGWRNLVPMALPTALSLCVVAASLVCLSFATRRHYGEPVSKWVAVVAGVGGFLVVALLWQAFIDVGSSHPIPTVQATRAVVLLAVLVGALATAITWLAQRSDRRRALAESATERLLEEVARRVQAEQAVRDNEQLLFKFLDAMPVAVLITRSDGHRYYANTLAGDLLGHAVVSDSGPRQLSAGYPSYVAGTDQRYPGTRLPSVQAMAGRASRIEDMEIHRPDGAVVPLEGWGTPVRDASGEVAFAIAVFVDISQRLAAERERRQQATLLDLAHDAIYLRDADGRITYWNRGAEAEFGWSSDEAIGRLSFDLLQSEYPQPLDEIDAVLRRDGHWAGEVVQYTRSGERRVTASRWVAVFAPDGAVESIMTINTDITAAKTASVHLAQRRAELEVLNEKLRRSNEDLEQFAYVASHDLSEPLRAISGPISLLARRYQGRLDAEADEFIGFAVDGCDRMQVLINDLLAYSRVGRRDSELSSVDMDSVLERALGGLQPVIAARHAVITSDRLPRIQARASQLTSLLQNLISNAIKYCAPGVVPRIHVGYADEGAFLRFSVTDNGIGIDVEHRERIFGMFKRLHTREAYAGTGIGLAVCKKIVESNGGHIGVSGGPDGSGSRFWFTLPNREDQRE